MKLREGKEVRGKRRRRKKEKEKRWGVKAKAADTLILQSNKNE